VDGIEIKRKKEGGCPAEKKEKKTSKKWLIYFGRMC